MGQRLTNEIVDTRLARREIRRVGNYVDADTPIAFECEKPGCNYSWSAPPGKVARRNGNASGCPKCAGNIKLTNKDIDKRLKDQSIKRLGNYVGKDIAIEFQCLIAGCELIWKTPPNSINNGSGCPQCAGVMQLTNDSIDERLVGRFIERLDDYTGRKDDKMRWRCLITNCGNVWSARVGGVVTAGYGCPKCAGLIILTNEIVDDRLLGRPIKRIGDYINSATKISFRCLVCNFLWEATPNKILYAEHGCHVCRNKHEGLVATTLLAQDIDFERQKPIRQIVATEPRKLIVDFYFHQFNTIVEYNGPQHYEPTRFFGGITQKKAELNFKKQQERDSYLQAFCDRQNILLIWIDGRSYPSIAALRGYIINRLIPMLVPA